MGAEKLSISLDSELAASVRAAASEQGISVSSWLADAAQAQVQVRQRRLREALDVLASEEGELDPAEIDTLIVNARRTSRVVIGAQGAA
jgi:CRISPR/Cas system-associated protein Csm6